MKYLSEKSIDFSKLRELLGNTAILDKFSENGWADFSKFSICVYPGSDYYRIDFGAHETLIIDKMLTSGSVRRIENGYFKGWFLMTVQTTKSVEYTIFNKKHIFADFPIKAKNIKDVDKELSNESITQKVIEELKVFDVTKTCQNYQSFCEKLPTECYKDKDFLFDIDQALKYDDDFKFINVPDVSRIDVEYCIYETRKTFKKITNKKLNLEKEKSI